MRMSRSLRGKKLIVFDLDGTLTESKSDMDAEMSRLLCALLGQKAVAVIGGGKYELFQQQLLARLHCPAERLRNLYLFPTTSTSFYRYRRGPPANGPSRRRRRAGRWQQVYVHNLALRQRRRIMHTFERVFRELHYIHPRKTYGRVIEDRGTQVTFSALGQEIVAVLGKKGVRLKKEWKKKYTPLKMEIARRMQKHLPHLEVRAAGYTSVDVTRKGIDKAYGVKQIRKHLKIPVKDMLFIGDALYPGGNDYAARRTGVKCIQVSGPRETKKIVQLLLQEDRG